MSHESRSTKSSRTAVGKASQKKLTLKKESLRDLASPKADAIRGGYSRVDCNYTVKTISQQATCNCSLVGT